MARTPLDVLPLIPVCQGCGAGLTLSGGLDLLSSAFDHAGAR